MNSAQTVSKVVRQQLGMPEDVIVVDLSKNESFEDEEESLSYPGLRTVYRKEIYEGKLKTGLDEATLAKLGVTAGDEMNFQFQDAKKYVRAFTWMTEQQCENEQIRLQQRP